MTTTDTWYTPGQIKFSKRQVQNFILPWLDLLREGEWPSRPSCYVGHDKRVRTQATFVVPAEVAAEMDERLKLCGREGALLERCYTEGERIEDIAKSILRDEHWVERRIGSLLRFVSGWRRPRVTYQEWLKKGKVKNPDKEEAPDYYSFIRGFPC